MMIVTVKKLDPKAIIPKYATKGSVAFDLYTIKEYKLFPKEALFVDTGLSFAIPRGYEMQVRQRSGLSLLHPNYLVIGVGTIDQDYRGEIRVPIKNWSSLEWKINEGQRIAQAVISPVKIVNLIEVDHLDETERGAGGFGHTGG